jgi:uncharacterized membrane protein
MAASFVLGGAPSTGVWVAHAEGEIVINRPVERLFDFVADERNEPLHNPRMVRCEQRSDGPIGLGTQFRAETKTMGRTVPMLVEFTAYERPRRLGSRTRMSGVDIEGELTFEPLGEATWMQWSWHIRPRGVLRIMTPLVGFVGRRQEQTIWGDLKKYFETQTLQRRSTRRPEAAWARWCRAQRRHSGPLVALRRRRGGGDRPEHEVGTHRAKPGVVVLVRGGEPAR